MKYISFSANCRGDSSVQYPLTFPGFKTHDSTLYSATKYISTIFKSQWRVQLNKFVLGIRPESKQTRLERPIKFFHFIIHIVAQSPQSLQSTPENWGLISMTTRSGRGSGRRGINFSEYRQGFRHSPVFPQWLLIDPRTTSREPSNSLLVGLYAGLLFSHSQTHHGLRRLWVPSVLNWLSDFYCCGKSWLKVLKVSYLQYISIGVKIRGIKSFPPLVKVWKQRPKGDRYKSLGLPTFQSMSNLTLFEKSRQARRFGNSGTAIATLTLASEGGEG